MKRIAMRAALAAFAAWTCAGMALALGPSSDSAPKTPWPIQPPDAVRLQAMAWLDAKAQAAAAKTQAAAIWDATPRPADGAAVLERLVNTFALADDNARRLVERCSRPHSVGATPSEPWLADGKSPPFESNNLRLWYGRWLAQQSLFDEASEQLEGLKPDDVVDPASLLFYQSVAYHQLLKQESGVETIGRLLDGESLGPKRYMTVARLMDAELRAMREDSLEHIAMRMEDIQRRLRLGRSGPKVRTVENGVITSLDKLIKELEDKQQQQQQMQAADGQNMQPSQAAPRSAPMGGKGRGEVAKRNIGSQSGWGNLPPKQRDEAMQQIGREFPSHYRDVIEQYFRKLATEGQE
jgi:hypothetical protein